MTKTSGLADSPFFKSPTPQVTPPLSEGQAVIDKTATVPDFQTNKVTEQQTPKVTKPESNRLTELQTYRVERWDHLRRLELRLTREQKRYLDEMEEEISLSMPDIEKNNPEFQRLTKNSIIRVMVEIARQLDVHVDASAFHNEGDLLQALYTTLRIELSKLPD